MKKKKRKKVIKDKPSVDGHVFYGNVRTINRIIRYVNGHTNKKIHLLE